METTIVYWGYTGIMEKKMETTGTSKVCIALGISFNYYIKPVGAPDGWTYWARLTYGWFRGSGGVSEKRDYYRFRVFRV